MAKTVWLGQGPDGEGFEVEVGSPEHQRLLANGADLVGGEPEGYGALKVPELRALVEERELDVPSDAKKADLVAALEEADAEGDILE